MAQRLDEANSNFSNQNSILHEKLEQTTVDCDIFKKENVKLTVECNNMV